ncbi:hypothetical protein P4S65_18950 [Pseudoalteromonas sp. B131b]|uniref:hypothetical protein n=1 Tax=Pseudoalteromonas sp. B131b TaxID=630493 RepID=UPI00301CB68A
MEINKLMRLALLTVLFSSFTTYGKALDSLGCGWYIPTAYSENEDGNGYFEKIDKKHSLTVTRQSTIFSDESSNKEWVVGMFDTSFISRFSYKDYLVETYKKDYGFGIAYLVTVVEYSKENEILVFLNLSLNDLIYATKSCLILPDDLLDLYKKNDYEIKKLNEVVKKKLKRI